MKFKLIKIILTSVAIRVKKKKIWKLIPSNKKNIYKDC